MKVEGLRILGVIIAAAPFVFPDMFPKPSYAWPHSCSIKTMYVDKCSDLVSKGTTRSATIILNEVNKILSDLVVIQADIAKYGAELFLVGAVSYFISYYCEELSGSDFGDNLLLHLITKNLNHMVLNTR